MSLCQFSTHLKTESIFEISTQKYNLGEPHFNLGKNLFQFDHSIGYPLKIKMADNLIRCKEFNLEYDGGFHFSIDQNFCIKNLFG